MRLAVCSVMLAAGCRFFLGDDPASRDGGSGRDGSPGDGRATDASRDDASRDAAGGSVKFVQGTGLVGVDGASVSAAFNSAEQPGDLNLVVVAWTGSGTLDSVGDTIGQTYMRLGPAFAHGTRTQVIYIAPNIIAGATSVTATFATSVVAPELRILEYAGLATTGVVDNMATSAGPDAAVIGGPITTSHAHDLIVGIFATDATTSTTPDPAYALRVPVRGDFVEDREVTATGQYTAGATQSSAAAWIMEIVAFAAAGK